MKQYTNGKKGAVIILHQLCVILMIVNLYAMQYYMHEHIFSGISLFAIVSVIGLVGTFVAMAYLTNATGIKYENEEKIHYTFVDKIPSDILIILAIILCLGVIPTLGRLRRLHFDFAGSMVTAGTVSFILDFFFLLFYLSIVRRMKGNILFTNSVIGSVVRLIQTKIKTKRSLFLCTQKARESYMIQEAIEAIAAGELDTKLDEENFHGQQKDIALAVNSIRDGLREAILESTKNERMKADLITNVSHDIKTPLTSIINYVDLLKHTRIEDPTAINYIHILEEKSQRLKTLIEDLVEASKISSGNISLDMQKIDFVELIYQTGGEFNERFEARDLTIVTKLPNIPVIINADGRQLYRTIENLYTNASKYALEKTRVYVELSVIKKTDVVFTIKNIAKTPVPLSKDGYSDLTDRFVRGEDSRTTEGSGLGLSIAKNLTTLMGGKFEVKVDGDLFIAMITFKMA